ncbi:hypothetical protein DSECCO2_534460 [anaerobic digester metagenome]
MMNIIKTCFCLLFLFYSFFDAYCIEKTDSLYKIVKIKTKGDYYIIHAERNDSLFKIISKKVQAEVTGLELLKKGRSYYFDFGSNTATEEQVEPLSGIANNLDVKSRPVFIDGKTKIRFTKRFHYRLYTTNNLKGLFYVPNAP